MDFCGETIHQVLENFGQELAELSCPVWYEQSEGLKNASWKKNAAEVV